MQIIEWLRLIPALDWVALTMFFVSWVGYAGFARHASSANETLLAATNRYRRLWMLQATYRDNRVVDSVVVQSLSTSPSFFASTTILIIGGLFALLSAGERGVEFVREIPFAARTSVLVFDFKLLVLTGVFIFAFFRFTWSMRQYTFGALLVASMPDPTRFDHGEFSRSEFAERAGRMVGMAAETFNDGLRAYYMSFAMTLWFFSTLAFMIGSAMVIFVLYQREFRSEVLSVLRKQD